MTNLNDDGNGSVLIVEDEAELRTLFTIVLGDENLAVLQAHDGNVALALLQERASHIRLLITDLGIPSLGGVELIARARELNPDMKIIGTSGMGGQNIQEMVIGAGADAFLAKPFSIDDVVRLVRRLLALR
jgi:DNA-binding response OmpR family regulator